jgi:hypothetical protein
MNKIKTNENCGLALLKRHRQALEPLSESGVAIQAI